MREWHKGGNERKGEKGQKRSIEMFTNTKRETEVEHNEIFTNSLCSLLPYLSHSYERSPLFPFHFLDHLYAKKRAWR